MPRVLVKSGPNAGTVYEIGDAPLIIGRDDRAEIQILDQGVSRRHAEVFRVGEMHFVRDLQSRNGTFVNEERIEQELLRDGDELRIGSTILLFEDKGGGVLAPYPPRRVRLAPHADATTTIRIDEHVASDLDDLAEPDAAALRARDVRRLYRCAQILAEARDPQRLAEQVVELTATALRADHACLFLRAEGSRELELQATYQPPEHAGRGVPVISAGAIRKVVATGRAILSSGEPSGPSPDPGKSVLGLGRPRSVIAAPLIAMEHVHGVLYVAAHEDGEHFDEPAVEFVSAVALQTGIALQSLWLAQKQEKALFSTVRTLAGLLELRDPVYTGHSARVASYCAAIARALGLAPSESRRIQIAALLHNVAHIVVGSGTYEESSSAEALRKRYEISEKIIRRIEGLEFVLPVIRSYHERMDGSGLPDGLSGDRIPLAARILAVADRLDSLMVLGVPPEHRRLSLKEALLKLREEAPGRFDERVVDALIVAHRSGQLRKPEFRQQG
ncbi:MAG: FHA domain-containing protein [Planctomycetota bacterium]|nr:MAG: FHA domain-containing protein [Planctomycetota bacterium]